MLPTDSLFFDYPSVSLGESDTRRCKNAAPFSVPGFPDGFYRFYGPDYEFLCFGEIKATAAKVIKSFNSTANEHSGDFAND